MIETDLTDEQRLVQTAGDFANRETIPPARVGACQGDHPARGHVGGPPIDGRAVTGVDATT